MLGALTALGVLLGTVAPASASTTCAYDTSGHAYDGALHIAQAHTSEEALTASLDGPEGAQVAVATATGHFFVLLSNSVAADTGGFSTFGRAKTALGSPGKGNVYDHVVEQSQIARSGFAPEQIHNPANLNAVSARVNQLKANYYSTKPWWAAGGTVRDWLTGQSFADQHAFGMTVTQRILDGTIGGAA